MVYEDGNGFLPNQTNIHCEREVGHPQGDQLETFNRPNRSGQACQLIVIYRNPACLVGFEQ